MNQFLLHPDRFFSPDPAVRQLARELYEPVASLPIVSPHGHVDPRLFADPDFQFGSPTELFLIPDHYVFRMLYSQGYALEALGIPPQDDSQTEDDHRKIWQIFAENFKLFRGTPTGIWIREALTAVFHIHEKLTPANAQTIYDQINAKLQGPDFTPRHLYERFNIETLCTTDATTDPLSFHQAIRESGWNGRILPTFRPDVVINLIHVGWKEEITSLSQVSGIDIVDYVSFIAALEQRRAFFKAMGAKATDHGDLTPFTAELTAREADTIFQRALRGNATSEDARRFTGHMLMEMARMKPPMPAIWLMRWPTDWPGGRTN